MKFLNVKYGKQHEWVAGKMKVHIHREECIGCGVCEALCPEVFKLVDDGKSSIVEKHRRMIWVKARSKATRPPALRAPEIHAQSA